MADLPADLSPPQRAPGHVVLESSVMKLTRGHSCVLCQQRKVRCDKNKPCANCVKAKVECKVIPPLPPRRRKKKPHERDLIDRLKKYEALLSQHGVNFEPSGDGIRVSGSTAVDDTNELEHGMNGLKTSPSSTSHGFASPSQASSDNRPSRWSHFHQEFKNADDLLRGSSGDESDDPTPTIHHAFDRMFDCQDGFPFVIGGSTAPVTELHPVGMQVFQLWQIYLTNVNPLLKLIHTATLQGQIIEAAADTSRISKPLEALMFSIYFIAITSMPEDEVQKTFKEDKNRLMSRYHHGAQQALINAGFMRSPEIVVLQAYLMYLLAVRQYLDPRSLYCLIGVAVRVAQRLGLHKDGEQWSLPPFEVELRRRLWWQLITFDKRVAEMTGSTITALSSSHGDCKWPLNINDTDLHVHAKDRIQPYHGPTEMVFCLTRIELTSAAHPDGIRPLMHLNTSLGSKHQFHFSPSPSSPDVVTHVANHTLPQVDLDAFIIYIENTYLKHCDPKIPLHLFTLMMTRQNLCKLRIIDYINQATNKIDLTNAERSRGGAVEEAARDDIILEAVRTIEYDNIIQSTESLRGFIWYTYMHFPMPAYLVLANELRTRTTGELCERAWSTIDDNHQKRGLIKKLKSPMHIALGSQLLKAWDAHEAAQEQLGRSSAPQPRLISILRETAKKMSKRKEAANSKEGPRAAAAAPSGNNPMGGGAWAQQQEADMSSINPMMNEIDVNMFPTFDGVNQHMFSSALPGDMDFGQLDWGPLMQSWGGVGMPGMEQVFTHTNTASMPGPDPR